LLTQYSTSKQQIVNNKEWGKIAISKDENFTKGISLNQIN
jgi:hypothetical protein